MKVKQIAVWSLCLLSCGTIWSMDQQSGSNTTSNQQQQQHQIANGQTQLILAANNAHHGETLDAINASHLELATRLNGVQRAFEEQARSHALNAAMQQHMVQQTVQTPANQQQQQTMPLVQHQQEMATQANTHVQAMGALQAAHQQAVATQEATHDQAMATQRAGHEHELDDMRRHQGTVTTVARRNGFIVGGLAVGTGAAIARAAQIQAVRPRPEIVPWVGSSTPAVVGRTVGQVARDWAMAGPYHKLAAVAVVFVAAAAVVGVVGWAFGWFRKR